MAGTNCNVVRMRAEFGNRRDRALINAHGQIESILNTLLQFVRVERGELAPWAKFDTEALPDVMRALVIRAQALNSAIMAELPTSDLEALVYCGEPS
jgi:hypothetical protein